VENIEYLKEIKKALAGLEERVSRIELQMNLSASGVNRLTPESEPPIALSSENQDALEFNIGQFWFAKAGMLILMLGIGFLLIFPYKNIPPILPGMAGYFLAFGMLALARYWNKSFTHLSRYFRYGGLVLLYFSTLRLYYFYTYRPVLDNRTVELILLSGVVLITLVVALRSKSAFLTGLGLSFGYGTALIGRQPVVFFPYLVLLAFLAVYFKSKNDWPKLLIYAIIATYCSHLIWFVQNRPLGNVFNINYT